MSSKQELRKKYLSILASLTLKRKKQASKDVCSFLIELCCGFHKVASFAPTKEEIDLWPFNREMILSKKLCLPVVSGQDLIFVDVKSEKDLQPSKWGVLEPALTHSAVKVDEVDLFIIPALAFDSSNDRLGRGKGYYDAFIAKHQPQKTIGVGYLEQMSKEPLPTLPHDQKVSSVAVF